MNNLATLLADKDLTGEELALLPGLGPCELVHGRIVPMSPTGWKHGRYVTRLAASLEEFADQKQVGEVLTGEVGVYTRRNPDTVRGADVAFISNERLAQVRSDSYLDVAPDLIVEVVSPGNTWQEMQEKIIEYFEIGVEQVWIVEPEPRRVQVYRSLEDVTVLGEEDALEGTGVLDGFILPCPRLFIE